MFLLRNIEAKSVDDYTTVEEIFRKLQIITSCYVAFSIGANDVANAIGPVAAIIPLASTGNMGPVAEIPFYLLIIGGFGMAFGCITWGYKVMKTMGDRITKLTNTRGFAVDFGGATTVLFASKLGLPISTSHTAVGAIIGVGLAKGLDAIDLRVIRKIIISWLLTLPIAAITSAIIFIGMKMLLNI
jgi:PiT family inorganic phosphate transporter